MNFFSIVKKNFIFNFNKFLSFYFVNSLITGMLFVYGSLMFNSVIVEKYRDTVIYNIIQFALMGLIIFAVVFITYTNQVFLKNRGKEFGMYLTLGMTNRELTKLIVFENLGIMIASLVTGVLSGVVFGKLFYVGFNKLLQVVNLPYEINVQTFLLSIVVFLVIFIGNLIFNMVYIRKMSIIAVLKADSSKETGKTYPIIGVIAIIGLIISMPLGIKSMLRHIFEDQRYMTGVFFGLTVITPYFIIGTLLGTFKVLCKKIPQIYNNNLLILSSLSHRFLAYKNILYILTILVAGSIFFVGYTYTTYTATKDIVERNNPHDIMFVSSADINNLSENEVNKVVQGVGATVEEYKSLEALAIQRFEYCGGSEFKEDPEVYQKFILGSRESLVVSQSNFNKHMNENVAVKEGHGLQISTSEEQIKFGTDDLILTNLTSEKLSDDFWNYELNEESYSTDVANEDYIFIPKENITTKTNIMICNNDGATFKTLVLNDNDYTKLKNSAEFKYVNRTFNLLNTDKDEEVANELTAQLKKSNNFDDTYWKDDEHSHGGEVVSAKRLVGEDLKPQYKIFEFTNSIKNNGIIFFTIMFIGALFVVANGVVLYYKVLSDASNEEGRVLSLRRLGSTDEEIKGLISKELAVTFAVPLIVGATMGLYYIYVMYSNTLTPMDRVLDALLVVGIFALAQTTFYFVSRRKYINEVMNIR